MPRGHKSSYTGKQKRMAEHIGEGYENAACRTPMSPPKRAAASADRAAAKPRQAVPPRRVRAPQKKPPQPASATRPNGRRSVRPRERDERCFTCSRNRGQTTAPGGGG